MSSSNNALIERLKHRIVWCVISLVGAWFYLLCNRAYAACGTMTIFVMIAVFHMIDQFVFSQITPDRINIIPELQHDLTPDAEWQPRRLVSLHNESPTP